MDHFYAVIMAGGGGTRLWPLSRRSFPKQMLKLGSERTLFQMAVDRLEGLIGFDNILVVTVREQAAALQAQCPQIPAENFLLEPQPRGTASVVGLAAVVLDERDPAAIMVVLTADHYIKNVEHFQDVLRAARLAAKEGYLVTLGIRPTYPATGYGYIQRGGEEGLYENQRVFRVLRFKEKPDNEAAREMLVKGDHDWNSGMFIWQVSRIREEFERSMPELAGQLEQVRQGLRSGTFYDTLGQVWPGIKPETIDYGIMEKAANVVAVKTERLGWNDVGSWESLFETLPVDKDGNILLNVQHTGIETRDSLVTSTRADRLIVTIGLKDMIIVDTYDALLVCARKDAQQVKELVSRLEKMGKAGYL